MDKERQASLIEHLEELRTRILRSLAYLGMGAIGAWFLYPTIFRLLTVPVMEAFRRYHVMISVSSIAEPFTTQFQVSLVVGAILAAPLIILEVWGFVAPGLYRQERRLVAGAFVFSVALFFSGVALAWWMLPRFLAWFASYTQPGVTPVLSLGPQMIFLAKLFLAFGLCFQVPVVMMALVKLGIVRSDLMVSKWREAIFLIFVAAAVITPTWDVFTMSVCALPMVALYLLSIPLVKRIEPKAAVEPDVQPD